MDLNHAIMEAFFSDSDSDNDFDTLLTAMEFEERRLENKRRGGPVRGRRVINRNQVADHNRSQHPVRSADRALALSPPPPSTSVSPSCRPLRHPLPLAAPSVGITLSPEEEGIKERLPNCTPVDVSGDARVQTSEIKCAESSSSNSV